MQSGNTCRRRYVRLNQKIIFLDIHSEVFLSHPVNNAGRLVHGVGNDAITTVHRSVTFLYCSTARPRLGPSSIAIRLSSSGLAAAVVSASHLSTMALTAFVSDRMVRT